MTKTFPVPAKYAIWFSGLIVFRLTLKYSIYMQAVPNYILLGPFLCPFPLGLLPRCDYIYTGSAAIMSST